MKRTINIQKETWRRLSELKLELSHSSLDETINYLFYEVNKIDLEEFNRYTQQLITKWEETNFDNTEKRWEAMQEIKKEMNEMVNQEGLIKVK